MEQRREGLVLAIGVMKLVKAACLFAIGVASLIELPSQLAATAERAALWIHVFAGSAAVQRGISKLASLEDGHVKKIGALALAYGAVFLVEGVGLVMKKRWAEWLTVFVTGSFIPFEVYELVERFGVGKVITLVINVAVVVYLAWR